MRDRAYKFLTTNLFTLSVLILFTIITLTVQNYSYFFGIAVVLLLLWSSDWSWSLLGVYKPRWSETLIRALILSFCIFLFIDGLVTPLIEIYLQPVDLSSFSWLKGNFLALVLFTLFMWVIAAFGEEILYRGYIMKSIMLLVGDSNTGWHIGAILSSILFGLAHLYQGASGVILTGLVGLILAYVFFFNRKNLILTMMIHGFYDMIGITLIFLNKETLITDWVKDILV